MTHITSHSFGTIAHTAANMTLRFRTTLRRLVRNWDEHAAIQQLRQLDDRLLRDAGIDRHDLDWVAQLSLSVSPKDALSTRVRRP